MPHRQIVQVLTEARDATVPSKEGFLRAFNAIPAYRESFSYQSSYFPSSTLMFRSVRSTGQYIANFCARAFDVFDA